MRQILVPLFLFGLFGCTDQSQSKPSIVIVNAPESTPTNFETNDSSFLKIIIQYDSYEILFFKEPSTIKGINALDSFLQQNIKLINKEKVLVTGFENTDKYQSFKDVLSKYGVSRFRVNTP
jgi:hypothetical protein